jgi:hypothetical protein
VREKRSHGAEAERESPWARRPSSRSFENTNAVDAGIMVKKSKILCEWIKDIVAFAVGVIDEIVGVCVNGNLSTLQLNNNPREGSYMEEQFILRDRGENGSVSRAGDELDTDRGQGPDYTDRGDSYSRKAPKSFLRDLKGRQLIANIPR